MVKSAISDGNVSAGRSGRSRSDPHDGARDRVPLADRIVEQLDADHGQDLFGLARRSGLDDSAAEDAVQEALLRVWLEVRSGVDIIEPRAWVFRTLYRVAMDEHRVRRRTLDLVNRLRPIAPRRVAAADSLERASIWTIVDRLPTRQRQVMYLRYKADMTFDQVGAVMGITASAARAHASFGAGRLRELMGPEWQD